MSNKSKVKGSNFERSIVNAARKCGLTAERAYASNGKSLGHPENVDILIEDCLVIQAKYNKRHPKIYFEEFDASTWDALILGKPHCTPKALISLSMFLALLVAYKRLEEHEDLIDGPEVL